MLQFADTLLQWLPGVFLWLMVPIGLLSILLTPVRRLRPHAALGFMIGAAISAVFLAVDTAALGYVCCDQARMLFALLLDFRPGVTLGFALALFSSLAKPLTGVLPMVIGAAAMSTGAFLLRRASGKPANVSQLAIIGQQDMVS